MKREHDKKIYENLVTEQPSLYQVFLHNDEFTPSAFVIEMLQGFFYLDRERAFAVARRARTAGKAICGVFSRDYAESKVAQVIEYAHKQEYPLLLSMEAAH